MRKKSKESPALRIVRQFFPGVKSVDDATQKLEIEVTPGDAQSRAVKDHGHCVMAVACKRKLKLDGVIISRSVAYLIKGSRAIRHIIPPSVAREIVSFDRGGSFEVGSYVLSPVGAASRIGARSRKDLNPGRERANRNRRSRHITTNIREVLGGARPKGE